MLTAWESLAATNLKAGPSKNNNSSKRFNTCSFQRKPLSVKQHNQDPVHTPFNKVEAHNENHVGLYFKKLKFNGDDDRIIAL